jgi:hypothetical protein
LTWGIFVSLLVIAIGWGEVLCDMLSNITYIEHDLRAKLSGLVNPEVFWQYEAFKDRERGKWPMLNELFAPGLAIIIFAIIVKQTWPLSHHEWLFASASIILIVRLWERWLKVIQLRRNFVQQKQEVGA